MNFSWMIHLLCLICIEKHIQFDGQTRSKTDNEPPSVNRCGQRRRPDSLARTCSIGVAMNRAEDSIRPGQNVPTNQQWCILRWLFAICIMTQPIYQRVQVFELSTMAFKGLLITLPSSWLDLSWFQHICNNECH